MKAIAIAVALVEMVACAGSPPADVPEPTVELVVVEAASPTPPQWSVMTYNVNFGLAGDESIVAAIRDADADVVFLQETNAAWERQLRKALATQYPHMAFEHCCRAGGLAVLSKTAFDSAEYHKPKAAMFPAWRIVMDTPVGRVQVLNLHLHPVWRNGRSWFEAYRATRARHEREVRELLPLLDPALPALLVGDFNEDAATGTVAPLVREHGFETVLVTHRVREATWRWETRVGKVSWQLDHVYVGTGLRSLEARVIDAGASDHLPLVSVIVADARAGL